MLYETDSRGLFSGLQTQGCEADQSLSSSAELKNEWRCTAIPAFVACTVALPFNSTKRNTCPFWIRGHLALRASVCEPYELE